MKARLQKKAGEIEVVVWDFGLLTGVGLQWFDIKYHAVVDVPDSIPPVYEYPPNDAVKAANVVPFWQRRHSITWQHGEVALRIYKDV